MLDRGGPSGGCYGEEPYKRPVVCAVTFSPAWERNRWSIVPANPEAFNGWSRFADGLPLPRRQLKVIRIVFREFKLNQNDMAS